MKPMTKLFMSCCFFLCVSALIAADLSYEDTPEFARSFRGAAAERINVAEFNLKLERFSDWTGVETEKKGNNLWLRFRHKDGDIALSVAAMDIGYFPPESFSEVKREANVFMQSTYPGREMQLDSLKEHAVDGLSGFLREVATKSGTPAFREIMWDGSRKGFNYAIKIRSEKTDRKALSEVMAKLLASVHFPDKSAVSPRFVQGRPKNVGSAFYGYDLRAEGTYFMPMENTGQAAGKPEFVFMRAQRTLLAYYPVVIRNTKIKPEEILRGMLTATEVTKEVHFSSPKKEGTSETPVYKAEGLSNNKNGQLFYEARLHVKPPVYILEIAGEQPVEASVKPKPQRMEISFRSKNSAATTPDKQSEEQQRRHFHFLMKTGNHAAGQSNFQIARELYEEALLYHIDDAAAVSQICSVYDKQKNYAAGFAVTEKYADVTARNANLLSFKAYFAYKLNNFREAAPLYEASFEQGYWAYDEFEYMLRAYSAIKQPEKAAQLATKYLATQKNEELMRYVAHFFREEKQFQKAKEAIQDAEKKFGFTEKVGFEYAKLYYDQRMFREGLEVSLKMESAGFTDPTIFFNTGLFYYSLKDYANARKYFTQYQSAGGQDQAAQNYLKTIEDLLERTPAAYRSADFAYTLKIAGSGFRSWDTLSSEVPNAEYGLQYEDFGGMVVFSLKPADLTPPSVNAQDIMQAINQDHAKAMGKPLRSYENQGIKISEYSYPRVVEDRRYTYFTRIVERKHFMHAVIIWFNESPGANEERRKIFAFADNFQFDEQAQPGKFNEKSVKTQAWFLGRVGEIQFKNGDFVRALQNLSKSHDMNPADAGTLNLLLQALSRTQDFKRLYEVVLQAEKRLPNDKNIISWKAFAAYKTGRYAEAESLYAKLFQGGYWNDHDFRDYLDVLQRMGKEAELQSKLDEALKSHYSAELALFHANQLRKNRKHDKAEAAYKRLISENPANTDARLELGWLYIQMESPSKAVEICDKLIEQKVRNAAVEYLKGVALYKLGRYRDAKNSFEYVVRGNPKDADARDYLNYVTSLLGQGQNSSIQDPVNPVEIPGGYEQPKEAKYTDEPSVINRVVKSVYFKKGEPERTTYYYDFSIHADAGIAQHSKYVFTFDPLREKIFVNKLEVVSKDRARKTVGKAEEYYVIDEVDDQNIATGKKELRIVVPGLEVGSRGQLMISRESLQPVKSYGFSSTYLSYGNKVQSSEFFLCGDVAAVAASELNLKPATSVGNCRKWSVSDPVVMARESMRAPGTSFAPIVYTGTKASGWRELIRDYAAKIRDRVQLDETVKSTSAQIVANAGSDEEKLRRLTRYVQKNIKYQAIEFGTRGVIPNHASKTLSDKFGDCKDQSVLLAQLLKAQGFAAELALVSTYASFVETIPSLDQFNHMIVYLPNYKGGTFFDPTQKEFGLSALPPLYLEGQTAVLVKEDGHKILQIKPPEKNLSKIIVDREVTLEGDKAVIREMIRWTDYHAAFVRGYFRRHSARPLGESVQELMGSELGGLTLKSAKLKGLEDLDEPLQLDIALEIKVDAPSEQSQAIRIPAYWEKQYIGYQSMEKRRTPFQIEYPIQMKRKLRVRGPRNVVMSFSGKNRSVSNDFFRYDAKLQSEKGVLRSELSYENFARIYPAARYQQLKSEADQVTGMLPESLIFRKQSGE